MDDKSSDTAYAASSAAFLSYSPSMYADILSASSSVMKGTMTEDQELSSSA